MHTISIIFHKSKQVPVTVMKEPIKYFPKNPLVKAKTLGNRNGVTKINAFLPTGATICYTRQPLKVALGQTQEYDLRFIHYPNSPSHQFPELHAEFHATTITAVPQGWSRV